MTHDLAGRQGMPHTNSTCTPSGISSADMPVTVCRWAAAIICSRHAPWSHWILNCELLSSPIRNHFGACAMHVFCKSRARVHARGCNLVPQAQHDISIRILRRHGMRSYALYCKCATTMSRLHWYITTGRERKLLFELVHDNCALCMRCIVLYMTADPKSQQVHIARVYAVRVLAPKEHFNDSVIGSHSMSTIHHSWTGKTNDDR